SANAGTPEIDSFELGTVVHVHGRGDLSCAHVERPGDLGLVAQIDGSADTGALHVHAAKGRSAQIEHSPDLRTDKVDVVELGTVTQEKRRRDVHLVHVELPGDPRLGIQLERSADV